MSSTAAKNASMSTWRIGVALSSPPQSRRTLSFRGALLTPPRSCRPAPPPTPLARASGRERRHGDPLGLAHGGEDLVVEVACRVEGEGGAPLVELGEPPRLDRGPHGCPGREGRGPALPRGAG